MSGARVVTSRMAVALGRFRPEGISGYRAATMPDAPLRSTRADATADEMAWLESARCIDTRIYTGA